jgi:hypothetical protein
VPPPIEPIVPPSTAQALPRFAVGLQGGIQWLSAAPKTAKALFDGETSGWQGGGFATYGVTRNVFLTASGTFFQKKGERVFVVDPDGPIARLGHPLTLRLIPAHLSVGYRFEPWPSVVPYLSVGGGAVFFREESTIGVTTEKSSRTKGMGIAIVGVDYVKGGLLAGVQASWSTMPKIVGRSGVSAVYGEDDLGGVSVSLRLGATF